MKKIRNWLMLGILLLPQGAGAQAQGTSIQGLDAFEQNKRLGRGVNVLGYDPIWKDRSRGRFGAEHFRLIHEAGFSHVRINLHPFRDCGSTITEAYFQTLDWAIEQALVNKLMVILDFHEFNAMARDPNELKERFLAMWTQISQRYRDQPDEVLFEILNEPNGKLTPSLWNEYMREALAIIRRTNPVRTVVIGPAQYNQIGQLDTLELPDADRHIIVTIHSYSPMEFTHQGAPWTSQRDKIGVSWDGTPRQKEAITAVFDQAQAWSQKHNRPVHLGEFGVYDKAEMPSRVLYLGFVTREAEKRGWSWAYWQFDSDFILYDIPGKRWIEPVRDALIPPKSGQSDTSQGGQSVMSTNRPMRRRQNLALTVGQTEGDLQGKDDKVIQAGVEYLNRLGGGTLRILPGVYNLRNAIHLRPNITLQGSGESTVLRKADSVVTPLCRDSDWFEYGVQVKDVNGFAPGDGIMLRSKSGPGDWQFDVLRATVTAVQGDVIFLDQLTRENFWLEKQATAATIFPLLTAENVNDVEVKDIVLDGNREKNEHINGNFAGAVFIQHCNGWRFTNVTAREYNGDGFSFQVCDDIQFQNCQALNNADLGFHPGSGAQRPVFRGCIAKGNSLGLFFCWSVSDGLADKCILSENRQFGISIGHRDTDNVIRNCTIERNGEVGILFRDEGGEFRGGHRNQIEDCIIRDNGATGIDIRGRTQDVTVRNTRLGNQKTGIRICREAQRVTLQDNAFDSCPVQVEDLRSKAEAINPPVK
jgi:endoglucanase